MESVGRENYGQSPLVSARVPNRPRVSRPLYCERTHLRILACCRGGLFRDNQFAPIVANGRCNERMLWQGRFRQSDLRLGPAARRQPADYILPHAAPPKHSEHLRLKSLFPLQVNGAILSSLNIFSCYTELRNCNFGFKTFVVDFAGKPLLTIF